MSNFPKDPQSQAYAQALLDAFIYVNEDVTDKLFTSAFQGVSSRLTEGISSYAQMKSAWMHYRSTVLVTHPTGETPNVSDSGYMFDRKARQLLMIDEERLLEPQEVLYLLSRGDPAPVAFVDDFAGSGDQFLATWSRRYDLKSGQTLSFRDLVGRTGTTVFYTPAVCTETAARSIATHAPEVVISTSHLLSDRESVLHPDTLAVPENVRSGMRDFIVRNSAVAGIFPEHIVGPFGYKDLALTIAFAHSVPDATLPLYWSDTPGWTNLVRRR